MVVVSGSSAVRRRGRPQVVEPETVAAAALRVWSERGVRRTTWADLADATGVSVRTLMRHFPDPTDIAWVGVPAAVERLERAAAAVGPDSTLSEAIRHCVLASVVDPEWPAADAARWGALVAGDPELRSAAPNGYRPWAAALASVIAARAPGVAPATVGALAAGVTAMTFEALLAATDADKPLRAVAAVLDVLDVRLPAASPAEAR